MLLLELVDNLAILISISVLYDLLGVVPRESSRRRRLLAGILFGAATVVGMMSPMRFAPGVIYDGRSIILTVAGILTGASGAGVAALLAGAYRVYLGGAGTAAGLAVVATSAGFGVVVYYLRRRSPRWNGTLALALIGFLVHLLMLIWQLLFLPESLGEEVLRRVGPVMLLGYPAAFVLVGRLLLDRERARELSREKDAADELYRGLFENTHAIMLAIRPEDGRIVDANSAAEAFYGWSRDELTGMNVSEINTLSDAEVQTEIARARRREQEYFEFRHRRADGSIRDVAVRSGIALVGERALLHSVIFDITERKRAERERDLMLFGMDHAAIGVMRIRESDGVVESANLHACALLGYEREELEGARLQLFDATITEEGWTEHRRRARAARKYTFETVHRRKNGGEYPAEVTVAYVTYRGEEYSFSFFQDITERKRSEERMAAALREKEVLLQEIHHRVKNNLSVISSLVNLQVGEAETSEEAHAALEKTRDRISTMGEVHNNLYGSGDFSRLDFCEFLKQRVEGLSFNYRENRPIDVSVSCGEVEVNVEVAVPLGLVLNELLTNAFKHAFPSARPGEISVSAEVSEQQLFLRVMDDGIGLPQENGAKRETAIGLQLVQLLAEQIDAQVSFHTDRGTSVEFRVPLKG
ncbi:MAG: PAS domain S-box protein [Alkalispirochaetaceae bacterium]